MESGKTKLGEAIVRVGAASIGAPLAAVLGPEMGAAVSATISEAGVVAIEWLDSRASDRVTATLTLASDSAAERRRAGEQIREELADSENDDAASLFALVVESAARSSEARKCEAIANAYVEIAFDNRISVADALLLIGRLNEASWRQLVALAYFADEERQEQRFELFQTVTGGHRTMSAALISELLGLSENLGMAGPETEEGRIGTPSLFGGGEFSNQGLGKSLRSWKVSKLGEQLVRIAHLAEVVTDDDLLDFEQGIS